MLGWRGRIGIITTAIVKRGPGEFYKVAPDGVDILIACLGKKKEKDTKNLDAAIKILRSDGGVDCIIYSCTGRVTRETHGTEDEIIKRIEDISGKPATTTIRASADAMQHLSIKKILISSHSHQTITEQLKKYFENRGFEVPFTKSLANVGGIKREIAATLGLKKITNIHFPDDLCYTQGISAFRELPSEDAVDGIYIPCAQWTTHKYLNMIEEHTGIPVVATHRSNVWWSLKTLGIKGPIPGNGKLLGTL